LWDGVCNAVVPMHDLAPPMRHAMELAWTSIRSGSLGVGSVIATEDGRVVATGRNRLFEADPGDDVLAGSSLAHAEMNALAKLPWARYRSTHLVLWTTLQPCLQCLGAIRMSDVDEVRVLAPDPLFRGVEQAQHLTGYIARAWPAIHELPPDEWSVLALLFPTHTATFWSNPVPGWNEPLPTLAALAQELTVSGELVAHAVARDELQTVAAALWDRLTLCIPDVVRLAELERS
jgi:tRNA(Arg) A34 adenosine deaminase TadA